MHKKNSTLEVLWRNWHEGVPDSLGRIRKLPSCRSIYVRSYDENTLRPVKSKVIDIKKNGIRTTWLVTTASGRKIRATMSHWFFTPTGWFRLEDLKPGLAHIYRSGKAREGGEAYIPPRTRQGIQILANRGSITATLRADRIISITDPLEEETYDLVLEDPHHNFLGNGLVVHNSGRYKKLKGVFWVPDPARGLVQEGKPGHYIIKPGTKEQYGIAVNHLTTCARECYRHYEEMLNAGICREVARAALTVGVYTSFYVTMNARGLMNFLSLRIDDIDNTYETKPQYEIQQVALDMQDVFSRHMPITFNAFDKRGRVAP